MRKERPQTDDTAQPTSNKYLLIEVLLVATITMIMLHQIEAGYEQEWALYNMRFDMTGFLLLNIVIVALPFLGFYWLMRNDIKGLLIALIAAGGSWVPVLVHMVFMPKPGHFEEPVSFLIMLSAAAFGTLLLVLTVRAIFHILLHRSQGKE